MHEAIIKRQEEYRSWIEEVAELSPLCYRLDEVTKELSKLEGVNGINSSISFADIDYYIYINHTKFIKPCLTLLCKTFGKITRRRVEPPSKQFNFEFIDGQLDVWFNLTGDSCKLIQVGTKTVEHPIYELQCGNGKIETITDIPMESEE